MSGGGPNLLPTGIGKPINCPNIKNELPGKFNKLA